MNDDIHRELTLRANALKAELPGVSFGYIGNVGVDRSGPYDDRTWTVFLPHPGRVGTIHDRVGSYSTARLSEMLAHWDAIADMARTRMANDGNR